MPLRQAAAALPSEQQSYAADPWLERVGPPELLSPAEALQRFAHHQLSSQVFIPLNLSLLSEQVVGLALRAPDVRSGPPSGHSALVGRITFQHELIQAITRSRSNFRTYSSLHATTKSLRLR
jgi:hypothetical protein